VRRPKHRLRRALRHLAWRLADWPVAIGFYVFLGSVYRSAQVRAPDVDQHAVFVHWHRDVPFLIVHYGRLGCWMMVSPAPNMIPIHRLCRWLGMHVVVGATGAGGGDAVRALKNDEARARGIALAVDGPAGPGFVAKPGCAWLARDLELPIVPVSYRARREHPIASRWDRIRFHGLRERFDVVYGEPIVVAAGDDDADVLRRVEAGLAAVSGEPATRP
jgi:lysophospholipid acyltransferase (LPLAT)-like uncharacterized protein